MSSLPYQVTSYSGRILGLLFRDEVKVDTGKKPQAGCSLHSWNKINLDPFQPKLGEQDMYKL